MAEKYEGNWSRLEVRAVIRFLWGKNVSESAMSRQHVAKLCHSLQSGRQDVESRSMTGSGRSNTCFNDRNHYGTIGEMIQNDRMMTQQEISSELGLS
ncbi:UNVERIFIED_CONTAM: hypothetical protein NCL1_37357 [Trichonephila clavipes]